MNAPAFTTTQKTGDATKKKPAAIPPMPDYNARVLAYLTGAGIIISGILEGHFDSYLIWMIPGAMLWPHLLYFTVRYLNRQNDPVFRQQILLIDSFLGGTLLVVLGFSLTPSLFVILMLQFSLIIVGGMKSWLYGNLTCLFGVIFASIFSRERVLQRRKI